ncbi:phosphoglucomutase [Lachnotalea glycerini]|uniref:Phosphoglucomutase n=1 Tax=Lachnotalea glycerini TaxID=1763509 RepID=A0A255IUC5_9FIRM|nr:phospho-sugar mutase [Lachnotalea glycerini]PXV87265.1 phosphoglucomutase [Lachnotalea glycerini]RDY31687.1 phospho-sugar mutase [Lachnotalea glycerini]
MQYLESYNQWLENSYFDENTQKELRALSDEEEIKDRFYKDLEFGTGGLRGIIGAGTNRMNLYTVRKATQGLANFIIKEGKADLGVAIAYDSRNMSPEFSDEAALCLNANGIKTYRFESLRPTPELSFTVRELGCVAGIVITASHNPPEYNGYKVYWEDGAQITAPKDEQIIKEVNAIEDYAFVNTMEKEEAVQKELYHIIGEEIDKKYYNALKALVVNPEAIKAVAKDIRIVYTPLHGTGNIPVQTILKEIGFLNVYVVPQQELPDANFSTVSYPNPEDKAAFALALELAKEVDADIVLATDPDADRLGIYAKDTKSGEYKAFTGNMSGALICEYLLSARKEKGLLSENGAIVDTIVTTNMTEAIAREYGLKHIETLTGFKYIGEQIKFFEQNNSYHYEFGFEESYGCLVGTHARDKDAIVAVMSLCEAAAYYKTKGLTLWDQMLVIFEKYGYYRETLRFVTLKGADGSKKIEAIINWLRSNTPKEIGQIKVVNFRDYQLDKITNVQTGQVTKTGLPKSNVLYFEMEEDAWCCVRPSGTEPKIKFYIGVKDNTLEKADKKLKEFTEALMKMVD